MGGGGGGVNQWTGLVPRPFWEGETAWQLPQVQTVYRRNVTAIAYLIQAVKFM